MAKQSTRWKALEKNAAALMEGERVLRGRDFSASDVDVRIADFPELKIDAKAYQKFRHHSLLEEIRHKYCGDGDTPVLVTKHARQRGANVTIPLEYFAALLKAIRALRILAEHTNARNKAQRK